MKRRVVVTGMGAVTPLGIGLDRFWTALMERKSGVSVITSFDHREFPVHIAAEVADFDPVRYVSVREARRLDRFCQFALAAALEAVGDSGLKPEDEDPERFGCIWASGIGGLLELESSHRVAMERGPGRISPFFIPKLIVNSAAGQIAIKLKIRGPNYAVSSACASGQHSVGLAFRTIQYGDADVMMTGGSEATVSVMGLGGFCALRALSRRNDDPATASRPFSLDRDGFVLAEGAGALILEEYERAKQRGARIYGEILGVGMTDDAHHISAPLPDGAVAARAMELALKDAGVAAGRIDYVNAHGTSTQLNDRMETRAIRTVFGSHADSLPVSSTKSQTGHMLGAAGAVESVVCMLALQHQVAPATLNYFTPDPQCDLDYVPNEPRPSELRVVMSNSFGFGGHNVALVFGTV